MNEKLPDLDFEDNGLLSLSEVFYSLQGEGLFAGFPQLFIRTSGCNLKCLYCDTGYSLEERADFRFFEETLGNPFSAERLGELILGRLKRKSSFCITGGEPLIQAEPLEKLMRRLKGIAQMTILETNGTMPDKMNAISGLIDWVSMDIKLNSVDGCAPEIGTQVSFYEAALRCCKVYLKIPVCETICLEELEERLKALASVNPDTESFVQPIINDRGAVSTDYERLLEIVLEVQRFFKKSRASLQLHKLADWR